jgi:hypothetical protein
LEGLAMENVGIFYGNLVYFTAIWSILWPFGEFHGRLVYFSRFWYVAPRKIWQPWSPLPRRNFLRELLKPPQTFKHWKLFFQNMT